MESITLYLQPEQTPKTQMVQRGIIVVSGIFYLIIGISKGDWVGYMYSIVGGAALVIALTAPRMFRPRSFTFDEHGFAGPEGRPWKKQYQWNEISRIEEQMFLWTFITKSGRRRTMNLGNLTFEQHRVVKPKILDLARSQGVEVRTV
jgi:hypothetical protein